MSPRRFVILLLGLACASVFTGCDSTTPSTITQTIDNIAWLPDGSGMIAVVQKQTTSTIDGSVSITTGIYHVGADGTIGNSIGPGDQVTQTNYPSVLGISSDGGTAIGQLGAHIYRFDLHSGNASQIIQNANLLGVSRDLKYVVTSNTGMGDLAPLYTIYDISASPARRVQNPFIPPNIENNQALWIDGGSFVLTHGDSLFSHASIWDTTGNIVRSFPNSEAKFSASAYSPISNDLFVRNLAQGIDRINLTTGVRTAIVTQDTVESFDVSRDGTLLVYSSGRSSQIYALFAVNVANGHIASVAADAIAPYLSFAGNSVAYIHRADPNQDIKTSGISLPQ